jgi:hypothetical protein
MACAPTAHLVTNPPFPLVSEQELPLERVTCLFTISSSIPTGESVVDSTVFSSRSGFEKEMIL